MTPASARTVLAGSTYGLPPRGLQATQALLNWPNKSASAVLDYSVDFTALIADTTDSLLTAFASVGTPPVPNCPPPGPPFPWQWNPPPAPPEGCSTFPGPDEISFAGTIYTPLTSTSATPSPPPSPPAPPCAPPSALPLPALVFVGVTGNVATFMVSLGAPLQVYPVTVQGTTASGRTLSVAVNLAITNEPPLNGDAVPAEPVEDTMPFQPLNPASPSQTQAANAGTPLQLALPWPSGSVNTVQIENGDTNPIYVAFGTANTVTTSSTNGYYIAAGDSASLGVLGSYNWVAIAGTGTGIVRVTQGIGG